MLPPETLADLREQLTAQGVAKVYVPYADTDIVLVWRAGARLPADWVGLPCFTRDDVVALAAWKGSEAEVAHVIALKRWYPGAKILSPPPCSSPA